MTTTQRDAITTPATGLTIFNTNTNKLNTYNGTQWESSLGGDNLGNHTAGQNIQLDGNYLSGDGGNEGVFVDATGNVGIGTDTPTGVFNIATFIDAGPDSAGDGASLVIGDAAGIHMEIDNSEIHVMNGNDGANLLLNGGGGNVGVGTTRD